MPEGPTIVILKEECQPFKGKKAAVSGNAKIDLARAHGRKVKDFKSWGKHFLIDYGDFTFRVHFLLFGSYRVNERRENMLPRLSLAFRDGEVNFYACSVKLLEGDLDDIYDWSVDVMSDSRDPKAAKKKLLAQPDELVADALLDQDIFAGSGNIIKNEVLFRIKVHPKTRVGALPARKLNEMIREVRNYSFDFYEWKKQYVLRKHWLAHTKSICPRCDIKLVKEQHLGKRKRRAFYCEGCQRLYG